MTGTVEPDQRGKRDAGIKIVEARRQTVLDHSNSMPKVSSHYSQAKSPHRKYLLTGLNIKKLYAMYCACVL